MTTNNNLDALSEDAELPFGHQGRRSENTSEGFEPSPLVDQGPELDYTPDEYSRVVHYGPGDRPLCGNDSVTAVYTDDPAKVQGCDDCSEMVAQDLQDPNTRHGGPSPMPTLRTSWVVNTITSLTDQAAAR